MREDGFAKVFILLVLAVLLGLVGILGKDYLPFGFTEIAAITSAPQAFQGKEVKIQGKVTATLKIPFIDAKSYKISDGTAEISVITINTLPAKGEKVALIAIVDHAAIIGGEALGLKLKEMKRLPEFVQTFN